MLRHVVNFSSISASIIIRPKEDCYFIYHEHQYIVLCHVFAVPIAVTNLALQSRTTSSLVVKWTAPSGVWTGYTVELDDIDRNVQSKSPQKDATSVEFSGLVAGTQYTVRVFTLSGGPPSVKMEDKFHTSKSAGGNLNE